MEDLIFLVAVFQRRLEPDNVPTWHRASKQKVTPKHLN
jgi:hypothetical protein